MKQIVNLLMILVAMHTYGQDTIVNNVAEPQQCIYQSNRTLQETKDFITRIINDFGHEKGWDSRKLRATFEGNLLRIVIMNKKYTEPINSGYVYNFARVHKFQRVSKRAGDIAYLNIWVDFLENEKQRKFGKRKLVLEIHHHKQADELQTAFRHLNKLLLDMEEPVEKF